MRYYIMRLMIQGQDYFFVISFFLQSFGHNMYVRIFKVELCFLKGPVSEKNTGVEFHELCTFPQKKNGFRNSYLGVYVEILYYFFE